MLLLAFMGVNTVFGWGCLSNKSNLFLHKSNYYASSRSSLLLLTRHDPIGVISSCRTYYCDTIYTFSGSTKPKKQTCHTISNFGKYRQSLVAINQSKDAVSDTNISHKENSTKAYYEAAEHAVILLAQKSRTWKRLAPIVELSTCSPRKYGYNSIADIGCDHGLLSIALASTGKFQKVIGVDVSHAALENGAKQFYGKAMHAIGGLVKTECGVSDNLDDLSKDLGEESSKLMLPVEFRIGDGLSPLKLGEADAICMAGMGVDTILSILVKRLDDASDDNTRVLDSLQCNSLFLQPPNSRPRKLMELYEHVHRLGFSLANERITKLKERYYITSHFDRRDARENSSIVAEADTGNVIPGSFLFRSPDVEQRNMYREFVDHHYRWLQKDFRKNGDLWDYDKLWIESNLEWNTTLIEFM